MLLEIKRVLKGSLVLTTPNVLVVLAIVSAIRTVAGVRVVDVHSCNHAADVLETGDDLACLFEYCGFQVETLFSADVHGNEAANFFPLEKIAPLLRPREHDLGQYLFSRARSARPAGSKRPTWLYRSYPEGELES